ncbi:MAG: glycerol-3-phosphate responsive antiterminator, partial [Blastomonas sp.]|nr:glycerol-3-phosphate responsive antiterminator [Blastomonas sp.]
MVARVRLVERRQQGGGGDELQLVNAAHPAQRIAVAPAYQVPFAEAIKREVAMPVIAVGLITEPQQAEDILVQGRADAIGLARAILY